jgi:hypothetical protein
MVLFSTVLQSVHSVFFEPHLGQLAIGENLLVAEYLPVSSAYVYKKVGFEIFLTFEKRQANDAVLSRWYLPYLKIRPARNPDCGIL